MTDIGKEVLNELKNNIIPFWTNRMTADDGSILGRIDGQGHPDPSDKDAHWE